jgi:hypothetical protein
MFKRFKDREDKVINNEVASLKLLVTFLKNKCGVETYLIYGSLLGAVRQQDVIPEDDDYDISIFIPGDTMNDVRSNYKHILETVHSYGLLTKVYTRKGIKVTQKKLATSESIQMLNDTNDFYWGDGMCHIMTPDNKVRVDVWSSWGIGDNYYLCSTVPGKLKISQVLPLGSGELRGVAFPTPRNPIDLVECLYGKGWTKERKGKAKHYKETMSDY